MSDEKKFSLELHKFNFDSEGIKAIEQKLYQRLLWPLVYILSDDDRAYVGETTNVGMRMSAHLANNEKGTLRDVRLVVSPQFNKSAALHLEAKLISYLAGEGKLKLVNRNDGIVNHEYYQQERYDELFGELWERLQEEHLAEKTLQEIDNSDLFKFSPYKALSIDQYAAVAKVISLITTRDNGEIIVRGAAGTGKTVLAIFLMKLLVTKLDDLINSDAEEGSESELDLSALKALKQKFPNPRIGLVVAMTSLKNTLKSVFKQVYGLSAKQVMSPIEASKTKEKYDILFVDESHRLRGRRAIGWMGAYDKNNRRLGLDKEADELDWVILSSKHTILFYDKAQSVKPSDVYQHRFQEIIDSSPVIDLETQHRSKGGKEFTRFVRELLDDRWETRAPFDAKDDFELLMFENFGDMVEKIKARNEEVGLSRLIAGNAFDWNSKKDPAAFDIEIDGVQLRWNITISEWINSPSAVNEVGCIHTTQGYDLNYAGIILGPEIGYDKETERIVVYKDLYKDRMGKQGIKSDDELSDFIKQIYYTMLCRGMRGTYVYVCDKDLRSHFKSFFKQYKASSERKAEPSREAKIIPLHQAKPYINSIPYFDIAAAAGEFSETQMSEHPDWIQLEEGARIERDYFACKVVGESMNKRIPDGSICLFSKNTAGSNQGKIVLAEHRKFEDSEFGAGYTIKQYSSIKKADGEFDWMHKSVHLKPLSNDSSFATIVLTDNEVEDLKILGEFLRVVE